MSGAANGSLGVDRTRFGDDASGISSPGGFGASWIDNLRRLGRAPIGIALSGRAADPRYDNKRTEMYFETVD